MLSFRPEKRAARGFFVGVMWLGAGWLLAEQAGAQPPAAAENPYEQETSSWEGAVNESAADESAADEGGPDEGGPDEGAESPAEPMVAPDAHDAASEQPVSEQPVSEQPVSEQPVSEQPVSEQPVSEQPAPALPASARVDAGVDGASTGLGAHRVTAIALTGLSFLGVGVGTSYAIQSIGRRREADMHCAPSCTSEADRLNQRAHEAATVAQVAFAVGLVALGGAAYLWLTEPAASSTTAATEPRSSASARALGFDISAGPGLTTAWLGGTF